jgi:hypothetical protein
MKTLVRFVLILSFLAGSHAFAQTDLSGTWQGKLDVSPNESITIQFVFSKKADGTYSVVLNSQDSSSIKNVAANTVKYSSGKLSIDVASLSGSFSGTAGKGTITGEWRQQGGTFPLVLTPYKKPDASSLKPLLGEWVSRLKVTDEMSILVVYHFEYTKDGKTVATFDQPDQGIKGYEISDVSLEGDHVRFRIPIANSEYNGTLSNNTITGIYKVSGRELPQVLKKEKYQASPAQIDISADAMKLLLGRWVGQITNLTIVFRFERDAAGKPVVFVDSPDQGVNGLPVAKAAMTNGTLTLDIPKVVGKYSGTLNLDKIEGTWTQLGNSLPLTLVRTK